jgi:replication factor A1
MLIGDETSVVAIVFWDEKADNVLASKITKGKIVRILHGYSRERQGTGEIEVNIGNRGQVYMEPLDTIDAEFPKFESFFKTPKEINTTGPMNIEGVIVESLPVSNFIRKDGSEGRVSRLTIEEGGRQIQLVLWDEKVDELGKISNGTRIRIIGGQSRTRTNGGFEVHLNRGSEVEVVEEGVLPREPMSKWSKIGELKAGMRIVSVIGRVMSVNEAREFTRKDGTKGKVASVIIEDGTGVVRLSLWDDDVNKLQELKINTIVAVENGYTRAGFGDGIDLNVGRSGSLKINPDGVNIEVPPAEERLIEIKNLREGQKNIAVQGQLLDDPVSREVNTIRGPAIVVSFRIDDGTGEARVSLWKDFGKQVEGLAAGARIRIENSNIREPFDGLMQISSSQFTKIVILKK